jgi:serine/threonine protein kinase
MMCSGQSYAWSNTRVLGRCDVVSVAKLLSVADDTRMTKTGSTIGTFAYIAPERLEGSGEEDARVDIYSLACVLYECLPSRRYFTPQRVRVTSFSLIKHRVAGWRTALVFGRDRKRPDGRRPGLRAGSDAVTARPL